MNTKRVSSISLLLVLFTLTISNGAAASGKADAVSAATVQSQPAVTDPPAWHNTYPTYNDVKMRSATDGWIVGQDGVIKHLYNGGWGDYPSPITNTLNAVDVLGGDAWAVGDQSTVIHRTTFDWQRVSNPAPVDTSLSDVTLVSPAEAWASGNQFDYQYPSEFHSHIIMHYISATWSLVDTPGIDPLVQLNQMSWLAPADGWVGGCLRDFGVYFVSAKVYHYSNGSWQDASAGLRADDCISSIYMRDANEGWATTYYGYIYHYQAGVWQLVSQPQAEKTSAPLAPAPNALAANRQPPTQPRGYCPSNYFNAIISFASNDYYAAGETVACTYEQTGYLSHNGSALGSGGKDIRALAGVSPNDLWGIGRGGTIVHWDGNEFKVNKEGVSGSMVQMLAPDDGWLLSYDTLDNGYISGQLNHYNGTAWQLNTAFTDTLETFNFASPNDGWAYNNGQFSHYDGYTWSPGSSVDPNYQLYAMQMLTHTLGWAAATLYQDQPFCPYPAIAEFTAGSWQVYTLPTSIGTGELYGLSFDSPDDGWAVGTNDDEGSQCPATKATPTAQVRATQRSKQPTGEVSPLVFHYSAGTWMTVTLPANGNLLLPRTVYARSPNDVWVGGYAYDAEYMLHWNGSTWVQVPVAAWAILQVQMLSADEGWAVGAGGFGSDNAIFHYSGGVWQAVVSSAWGLSGLSFDSPTDGWAVSYGGAQHFYPQCLDYYADVPAGYFAAEAVFYLSCHGIVSGTGNHIFSPNNPATRIQFAKMISLARGWPLITPVQQSFTDVPPSNPLYNFVETAHAHGAINGATPAGCQAAGATYPCFLPNFNISRAQTAIITQQAFAWPTDTTGGPHFSDVAQSFYAYPAIETCYNRHVVNGIGGGLFAPNANVTRAQIAVILYKALTLP